ncbi:hypothetical protein AKJ41_02420 [candidate division MSBL1 archaeon SCGC-AAA259O05]|uniref:Mandelate racemase/muconate lactonizing enzyme N-terminal domain-containing protein n=1 Tax=candidate division MSBL1 archaeon SCGC-AAA259O05 TaxID=1698271 RepID=A0A133V436_9EURY|nr:hypothetical protein AKJ41_02420 [candidate division MSBL1 archaeon SCGC-AAA259O05]
MKTHKSKRKGIPALRDRNMNLDIDPSNLEITDLRMAVVESEPYSYPILKVDTNQGIQGIGEARDGSDPRNTQKILKVRIGGRGEGKARKSFCKH